MSKRNFSLLFVSCLTALGCATRAIPEPTQGPTELAADPIAQSPHLVPRHGGKLITLARIEGGVDYVTGKPWARVVKQSSVNGVGVSKQALGAANGFCNIPTVQDGVKGSSPDGTLEFYSAGTETMTTNDDADLNVPTSVSAGSTCITRSGYALQPGDLTTFNTDGIGCLKFIVNNFSTVDFADLYVDLDKYNGTAGDHAPYLYPTGPSTVASAPIAGRNAPSETLGLWSFGHVLPMTIPHVFTTNSAWGFFREKNPSPFTWTGSLVAEKLEVCGNGLDDDCDGEKDNGCHLTLPGGPCYADDDCFGPGMVCSGAIISKKFGAGPGATDSPGACIDASMTPPVSTTLSSGLNHACAITAANGKIKCWGDGGTATGVGPQASARLAPSLNFGIPVGATAITSGEEFNCALFSDSNVRCWGDNAEMQARGNLGGAVTAQPGDVLTPMSVGGPVRQVVAGKKHACVVRKNGEVRCWGDNSQGQAGIASASAQQDLLTAADVSLPFAATEICAGYNHDCALLQSGDVYCWGDNSQGQLGLNNSAQDIGDDETVGGVAHVGRVSVLTPAEINMGRRIEHVSCGGNNTCVITDLGGMRCWGDNVHGQLGTGSKGSDVGDNELPSTAAFVNVGVGRTVHRVTIGDDNMCALLDDKTTKCWGFSSEGGCLGYGGSCSGGLTLSPPSTGINFGPSLHATEIGTHNSSATQCVRLSDGGIKCWNRNSSNQCGLGDSSPSNLEPPSDFYTLPPDAPFEQGTKATLVLGQPVFGPNDADLVGTAIGQHSPNAVVVDPLLHKVFVADSDSCRVLRYASVAALENGSPAEYVFGQYDFGFRNCTGGANGMQSPGGLAVDKEGHLWVSDTFNNRVLRFDGAITQNVKHVDADAVFGQPDADTTSPGTSATKMNAPIGITLDNEGRLWVTEWGNNRVLRFDDAKNTMNGAAADAVLGQPDFDTGTAPTSATATTMLHPAGLAYDSAAHRLWVADTMNHRVLRFDDAPNKTSGAAADGVLGKSDFTDGTYPGSTGARTLNLPQGITVVNGWLYVADTGVSRILAYSESASLISGGPATTVLGEPNLDTAGGGQTNKKFFSPIAIFYDSSSNCLWVPEQANNRVVAVGLHRDLKRVFVTSTVYTGGLGGVAGADILCNTIANGQGLDGYWMAWISDSAFDAPASRFTQSTSPYELLDGRKIANNWSDLTGNGPQHPIDVTELLGSNGNTHVWTNTQPDGTSNGPNSCADWIDGSPGSTGDFGQSNTVTRPAWSVAGNSTCDADNMAALYCFEQ